MAEAILHLSSVLRAPLVDRSGDKLGRVEDVIVRLADAGFPPVTGLQVRIGRRDLFVPTDRIGAMEPGVVRLAGEKLDLRRFERRPGEVLLRKDVLRRSLIHVEAARLVTAREIELMCVDGWWRVVGVDPSRRPRLRRLLPRSLRDRVEGGTAIEWTELEPFVDHVPSARLRFIHRRLVNLHPAQIADLVEAASHEEGEEIIKAVGSDSELEADVFEELDDEHQLEFIRERSDAQAAAVLSRMSSDDAADLIAELDQERRRPILLLMLPDQQRQIRALLGYNPSTAGGLMSPDEFVSLAADATVSEALRAVAESKIAPETLGRVYVEDGSGALAGSITVVGLLRSEPNARLGDVAHESPSVATDADLPDVARVMSDFNLAELPVVDEQNRVVGVVDVDDVLELMLPTAWRWRAGLARD